MERRIDCMISNDQDGLLVRDILRNKLLLSSSLIKKCKRIPNGITLNDKHVFVTETVHTGDILSVIIEEKAAISDGIVPTEGQLNIIYEDSDLLILDKPAGIPTHPSQGHFDDSLANIVLGHYKKFGQNIVFRAVNRLDKDTSGLLVMAKNAHVQSALSNQYHTGSFKREYLAVVCGRPPINGTIDSPIARSADSVIKREINTAGNRAVTHFEIEVSGDKYSLVRLRLETGRTHQIRVHMASMGHPLAGDFLYGTEDKDLIGRTALHSCFIELIHPITGERLSFDSALPEDMKRIMDDYNLLK